jgi:uncharacterized YigZ family protein
MEREPEKIKEYKTIYTGGRGEIIEKKSRFIATIRPVLSEEEAVLFIEEMKKKYWDARHNCSAFVIGARGELTRCSDDGEPCKTAGFPMLDVLMGENLRNVCAVVTRYFGGTLLGTGGLVRAYQAAVREGLSHCVVIEKKLASQMRLSCSYNDAGKLQNLIARQQIALQDSAYTDHVEMTVLLPVDERAGFEKKVVEATAGRTAMEQMGATYFAWAEDEIVLFEE